MPRGIGNRGAGGDIISLVHLWELRIIFSCTRDGFFIMQWNMLLVCDAGSPSCKSDSGSLSAVGGALSGPPPAAARSRCQAPAGTVFLRLAGPGCCTAAACSCSCGAAAREARDSCEACEPRDSCPESQGSYTSDAGVCAVGAAAASPNKDDQRVKLPSHTHTPLPNRT